MDEQERSRIFEEERVRHEAKLQAKGASKKSGWKRIILRGLLNWSVGGIVVTLALTYLDRRSKSLEDEASTRRVEYEICYRLNNFDLMVVCAARAGKYEDDLYSKAKSFITGPATALSQDGHDQSLAGLLLMLYSKVPAGERPELESAIKSTLQWQISLIQGQTLDGSPVPGKGTDVKKDLMAMCHHLEEIRKLSRWDRFYYCKFDDPKGPGGVVMSPKSGSEAQDTHATLVGF